MFEDFEGRKLDPTVKTKLKFAGKPQYVKLPPYFNKLVEYAGDVLEANGWHEANKNAKIYEKDVMPYNIRLMYIPKEQVETACEVDLVNTPEKIGPAVHLLASIPGTFIPHQIWCLNEVRENESAPGLRGIRPNKNYLRILIDGEPENGTYLALPRVDSPKSTLLSLGIIDAPEHVLPVGTLANQGVLETLIEPPELKRAVDSIFDAEMQYRQMLPEIERVADVLQATYYGKSQKSVLMVAISTSTPYPYGRQIIVSPSIVRMDTKSKIPTIDGELYLKSRVMTLNPVGDRPDDEIALYLTKTGKETLSKDVVAAIRRIEDEVTARYRNQPAPIIEGIEDPGNPASSFGAPEELSPTSTFAY